MITCQQGFQFPSLATCISLTGGTSLRKGTSWWTSVPLFCTQTEHHQCTGPSRPVPSSPASEGHAEPSG